MKTHESDSFLSTNLITYLGNKRKLLPFIGEAVTAVHRRLGLPADSKGKLRIFDGFAGSGVTARYFKQFSSHLVANDFEFYSRYLLQGSLANNSEIDWEGLSALVNALNLTKSASSLLPMGFIEELYAPADDDNIQPGERCFYTNRNAKIIDNMRRAIGSWDLDNKYTSLLMAPLLAQASVHTNTSGVFKGFHKGSDGVGKFGGKGENALSRITKDIHLPVPVASRFECSSSVYNEDVNELAKMLSEDGKQFDLAYFDPPYNQHPYGSNYFMLNLIAKYERPDVDNISKVSGIPKDWQRSLYNSKKSCQDALSQLIEDVPAKYVLLSYNNEAFLDVGEVLGLLGIFGNVKTFEKKYDVYKGSRNLREREMKNWEYLFLLEKS